MIVSFIGFYELMHAVKISTTQCLYSRELIVGAVNGASGLYEKQKSSLVQPLGILNIGFPLPNNKLSVYIDQSPSV